MTGKAQLVMLQGNHKVESPEKPPMAGNLLTVTKRRH